MTIDEVKTAISAIVAKPDEAAALSASLLESITADYTAASTLAETAKQQEAKIKDLQDTNLKLFLRVTGEPAADPEPELTGKERADAFWDKILKDEEAKK